METQAAVAALSHLGFPDANLAISAIPDGGSTLLRSGTGATVTLLRREQKYDLLVVGAQPDCPVPALRAVLETAVLPLSDDYAAKIGVAPPERDALRKRIREASVALDVIAKGRLFSVAAPEIPMHDELKRLVSDGASSVDDLPENFANDLPVLNHLQKNVITWSKEVDRLVQVSREGPGAVLSAEEETVFWSTLEAALSAAQRAFSSRTVKLSLDILARKRRATGFLIDANNSLDASRRKAAGVLTLIQGLPIVALRTAEDLSSLRKGVVALLEHIAAKLRISSFSIERVLSLIDSMGSDVNRSIGRILAEKGDLLQLPFAVFVEVFEACCELFESWSEGFDHCRKVARDAARKKNEAMPSRQRSPLSSLYNHLTDLYELRSDHQAIREAVLQLSQNASPTLRVEKVDSPFSALVSKCAGMNHFDFNKKHEAIWRKARLSHRTEMAHVEACLNREYAAIVRQGIDLRSITVAVQPFGAALDKQFMSSATASAVDEVLNIGRADLKLLRERASLLGKIRGSLTSEVPQICITLSECYLLNARADALTQDLERVLGKAHLDRTPDVKNFVQQVEKFRERVKPDNRFKKWLKSVDMDVKSRPLLKLEEVAEEKQLIAVSIDSELVWFAKVIRMAKENGELASLLSSRHLDFGRFTKSILRTYSDVHEAVASVSLVFERLAELDDRTHLRIFPFLEPLADAARALIEDGFKMCWGSSTKKLEEYASNLLDVCGHLWNTLFAALERDAAFETSLHDLNCLNAVLDSEGQIIEETRSQIRKLLRRMSKARCSLEEMFREEEVVSYIARYWIPEMNSALVTFLQKLTEAWFGALKHGHLIFDRVSFDAAPNQDGTLLISLIPGIEDVELSLIRSLGSTYESFITFFFQESESITGQHSTTDLSSLLLSQARGDGGMKAKSSSEAMGHVSDAIHRILRVATDWSQYVSLLQTELRCVPAPQAGALRGCKDNLEHFIAMYEDITSLREKDESLTASDGSYVLHDSRILSAKLLAKIRSDLRYSCDRVASTASDASQDLYKKISETRRLLSDMSGTDFAETMIALQSLKEDVLPTCETMLHVLSDLEAKYNHIAERTGDSSFASAQSAEAWILTESLTAHFRDLKGFYDRRSAAVLGNREALTEKFCQRKQTFQGKLSSLFDDFQNIRNDTGDEETFIDINSLIQDLEHQLRNLHSQGRDLEVLARAIGLPHKPDVSGTKDILLELDRVKEGYSSLAAVEKSMNELSQSTFHDVEPTSIRDELTAWSEEVENIALSSGAKREARRLQQRIAKALKGISLFGALKSVKLSPPRERDLLKRLCSKDLPAVEGIRDLQLAALWQAEFREHEGYVRQVLENAAGEASICDFITTVDRTWTRRKCTFRWHDGVPIVPDIPHILDELDEHLQALEAMSSSHHAKLFESERSSWERRLGKFREELECLADVQGRWAHIKTLFGSNRSSSMHGLRSDLQEEFTAFANVHARFCAVGDRLNRAPGLLEGTESALGLEDMKRELQGIVRGLSRFLEQQRSRFPRFFFLPDDDLLQVLSIVPSNIGALNPHIGKLFPGTNRFEYDADEDGTRICSVVSPEGEVISLAPEVYISGKEGVPSWLQKIQDGIVQALKDAARTALPQLNASYDKEECDDGTIALWECYVKHPAQVSLLILRSCFTCLVETCFQAASSSKSNLHNALRHVEGHLQDVCTLKKKEASSPGSTRRSLTMHGHLIKELVYQRDVIKTLVENDAKDVGSHHWNHSIRVYCQTDLKKPHVCIRWGLSEFDYGWEYLGVGETLVHTQLTSRSFLTLGESLRRGYGGSPFGPAGTGKTETVKALGRTLGRFVAVFNCDESFDSVSVGRILAGVCRIGCWVCFDEFNRLSAGILSSTSGQLVSLQACIRKQEDHIPNFYGGDLPISVRPGVGVFVTMNPTYSGRRELPANLQSLFRPCAMSKPDSAAIAEVLLLSCGFNFSSSLSKKIVTFFDSLKATVSQQPHYDFGLRSLKSTILASASLVQRAPGDPYADQGGQRFEEDVLIRAIEEVVKPKLSPADVVEYDAAVLSTFTEASSLSPELPTELQKALKEVMLKRDLTPTQNFTEKIRQLYWLIQHQVGVILVGSAGSGKSCVWRTLHEALQTLSRNTLDNPRSRVHKSSRSSLTSLDPKLLSSSQLYGNLDPLSREWTDGLFTKTLRRIADDQKDIANQNPDLPLHWIVFDGDVDPVWAENLNSVLDDNRILTLPSGEQIPLLENTRILFEADGLDYANPSTVSRCGMICFGEGNTPEVSLNVSLEKIFTVACKSSPRSGRLGDVSRLIINTARQLINSDGLVMMVPMQSIVRSVLTLLRSCLDNLKKTEDDRRSMDTEAGIVSSTGPKGHSHPSTTIFWRALVLSSIKGLCAGLRHSSRLQLSQTFMGAIMKFDEARHAFAELVVPSDVSEATMTSFGTLTEFQELVPALNEQSRQSEVGNPDVVIPTPTTVRLKSFVQDALRLTGAGSTNVHPLLLCGPPGCGKSLLLTAALRDIPNVSLCTISFSSETSHESILSALKGYAVISKRPNGSNVLHPKSSGCRVVLFCDEVNLEKPDIYGTQRSVSLLRSLAELGGFWDGTAKHWVSMEGIFIVAACNPEEDAGRNKLSPRFLGHCSVVRVEQPNSTDLRIIYGVFVNSLLGSVHEALVVKSEQVTSAMVDFFVENKNRFCPEERGPLLSHYIYSPRELSRWVRGLKQRLIDSSVNKSNHNTGLCIETSPDSAWKEVVFAFCYEARRLFIDRLPTEDERRFAEDALRRIVEKKLGAPHAWLLDVLYTSWSENDGEQDVSSNFGIVRNPEHFRKLIYRKLRLFAEEEGLGGSWLTGGAPSSFEDGSAMIDQFAVTDEVLTHLTRIERILCSPLGHAVLMGAPGTGKKTLARFAAWMLSMDVRQVHSHSSYTELEFAQDLRQILRQAGVHGKRIALIFDESHAMESGFLEIMNSLLACGDVPGLFASEERASLLEELRSANVTSTSNAATEHTLYAEFVNRVRNNLHIVFTISSGESQKLHGSPSSSVANSEEVSKRSPALFNRCTVDWIGDWTRESLGAVAELKIEVSLGREKDPIIRSTVQFHVLSREHFNLQHGRVTVTPRHFLEFVEQLNRIVLEKGGEIQGGVERHTEGLRRLRHAGAVVDELKDSLEEKALRLQEKEANANDMLKRMVEEQRLAEKSKVDAEQLALAAAEASTAVQARENEVTEQLAAVQPKVEAAKEAVGSIRKEYLEELRGMPNPPSGARLALEGVLMVLDASDKKLDGQYSWGSIRSRLRGSEFISSVLNFDARQVPKGIRSRIETKILTNPDFDVDRISFASKAAGPLAEWTLAVLDFAAVVEAVGPLQAEVNELQQEQTDLQRQHTEANDEVRRFELTIEQCKSDYALLVSEAEKVRQEIQESETNLRRSEEMLDSLADEWDRWVNDLNEFNKAALSVWGNSILGAAFLAYAGALDYSNRQNLFSQWKNVLRKECIPFDEELQMSTFLTSPHERGHWSSRGLPIDTTSLENYAILKRSARFPLIIDPTRQNAKLLRKVLDDSSNTSLEEPVADFCEIQISDASFSATGKRSYMRALESAMRFGTYIILDDADKFDRAVLPLLGQESSYGDATKFAESLNTTQAKTKDSTRSKNICQRVVRLGDRDVFLSPSFRMYMSTVTLHTVPQAAITRSNVVSFELSPDALGLTCVSTSLAVLSPEIEKQRKSSIVAALHNQQRKHCLEEEVLSTVNNVEDLGTELLRGSLLDNLSSLKREVTLLASAQKEEEQASAEIRRRESVFEPLGQTAVDIFSVLQRLRSFDPLYEFDTAFFLKTFEKAIGALAADAANSGEGARVECCQSLLLSHAYVEIACRLFPRDRLSFAASMSIVTLASTNMSTFGQNMDDNLEAILHAWSRSVLGAKAQSISEDERSSSAMRLLPISVSERMSTLDLPNDGRHPLQLDSALRVLRASLLEPHNVSKAVDDLACTLPGKDELVHGKATSPEFALRAEMSEYADPHGASKHDRKNLAPILLCSKGNYGDPTSVATSLAAELQLSLISVSMGSSNSDASVSEAISLASEKGDRGAKVMVVFKNMHLASKLAKDRLMAEVSQRDGKLSFLLIVGVEISSGLSISSMLGGLTFFKVLAFEALPSFRLNFSRALDVLSYLQRDKSIDTANCNTNFDRLQVQLSWLHACLLERAAHSPIGFKKPYEFSDGDLSAAWDVLSQLAPNVDKSSDGPDNLVSLLTNTVYGSRIEHEVDYDVLHALVADVFSLQRFHGNGEDSVEVFSSLDAKSTISVPLDERKRNIFVRGLPLEANPEWVHMAPLAPQRKHARDGLRAMDKILRLSQKRSKESDDVEAKQQADRNGSILESVLEEGTNLPSVPDFAANRKNCDAIDRFWAAESLSLRAVVEAVKEDITFLSGRTSMAQKKAKKVSKLREELGMAYSLDEAKVPHVWKALSPFYATASCLTEFFSSIRQSIDSLRTHMLNNERLPVNLSGVSRPKALIAALRYDEAARIGVAPHNLTPRLGGEEDMVAKGTLVSGITLYGARWDSIDRSFCLSDHQTTSASYHLSWMSHDEADQNEEQKLIALPLYCGPAGDLVCKVDLPVPVSESLRQWRLRGTSLSLS